MRDDGTSCERTFLIALKRKDMKMARYLMTLRNNSARTHQEAAKVSRQL